MKPKTIADLPIVPSFEKPRVVANRRHATFASGEIVIANICCLIPKYPVIRCRTGMGTDMDLRRIRTFVAVAEQGGVSRAALRLHIAQPALSRQIRALQEELGFQLFERVGRRLSLTGEGEEFLRDCRSLLSHAGSVVERAQSLRRGNTGVLRVAASPQMIESVFPIFL